MRKQATETQRGKAKARKLHLQGLSNKEIAKALSVTEKIVRSWLNGYKEQLKQCKERESKYLARIDELLSNEKANINDIRASINALRVLQKAHNTQLNRV
ncbi:MAG: hypothetical protein CSA94_01655 [Bacteroidetes bacterium]|nr:MAG: hypothetical protein CSA94_01655 [Bacteroidota bacterium]